MIPQTTSGAPLLHPWCLLRPPSLIFPSPAEGSTPRLSPGHPAVMPRLKISVTISWPFTPFLLGARKLQLSLLQSQENHLLVVYPSTVLLHLTNPRKLLRPAELLCLIRRPCLILSWSPCTYLQQTRKLQLLRSSSIVVLPKVLSTFVDSTEETLLDFTASYRRRSASICQSTPSYCC